MIHPPHIAAQFSAAAARYDAMAAPQRAIAHALAALVPARPAAVLDAGCGTGLMIDALDARWPGLAIAGIDCAPGMVAHCRARFPGRQFDEAFIDNYTPPAPVGLVTANCVLQWSADVVASLRRMAGWVVPGGLVAWSVPGEGSFPEFATAWRDVAGAPPPGLPQQSLAANRAAMERAGLVPVAACAMDAVLEGIAPLDIVRHFHVIGARMPAAPRPDLLRRVVRALESARADRLTYRAHLLLGARP
jgi:trans-aconitate methyltransferase